MNSTATSTLQKDPILNVVILAAGKGTRMRSALPKVLHPIAGTPMLCHVLQTALTLAPQRVVLVVGHGADAVEAAAHHTHAQTSHSQNTQAQHAPAHSTLHIAVQHEQLGTGHAVRCALPHLEADPAPGTTLVLYGDVPCIQASTLQALLHHAKQGALALLTAHLPNATGYGRIVRNAQNHIVGIVEEKDASKEQRSIQEINTGLLACPTALLQQWLPQLQANNAQGEYYLTDIVAMAHAQGTAIHGHQPDHLWEVAGVNSRAQQAELERAWQQHVANTLMHQGVSLADPQRLDVRGQLHCGQDVAIDVGCVFEGQVHLADGVHIGPHCVVRNASIAAGARIQAYTHIDGAQVGPLAVVGPYARLRPGSTLGEAVHIGNFVEIKNSQLAAHSKANHLSYLGDATVGERVNIGAGTITCNYDGANKHRTTIEDDAFIGSNTQLVAPVTVGQGATVGAGTTLTKNAPANALTVARAKQTTLPGWQRPRKTPTPPSSE